MRKRDGRSLLNLNRYSICCGIKPDGSVEDKTEKYLAMASASILFALFIVFIAFIALFVCANGHFRSKLDAKRFHRLL